MLTLQRSKLKLIGQPVELITEGFGGVETHIHTKLYSVPIVDKKNRVHYLPCYGTDRITADSVLPDTASYQKLCKKFNINPTDEAASALRPITVTFLHQPYILTT